MPEAIQGQDPEENDKLVKNVVPEEPKNERPLDLDDWSNRCIYHEAPETETDKLDFDDWSNRQLRSPLSLPPNQDSAKMPNQQKMVSCEVDEMSRFDVQFVFKGLNTLGISCTMRDWNLEISILELNLAV
ncbi:hypothetical protein H0E87_017301 [Populus deltoides]|uniref:Uncharacterized protein n=1 Tax=Populus deltoides TaxID=3696 RepID=A0A8T2XZU7_POPDE|nr:hypothetical protein H0E87_017301 [Populus deltoides]